MTLLAGWVGVGGGGSGCAGGVLANCSIFHTFDLRLFGFVFPLPHVKEGLRLVIVALCFV